ncbi:MAG TPA: CpsD/CapB family tyrosine-protein kinase [Steroidobacteraceae bacterium]|nr:CpsD/CapB family tyrosine-protein kinase [Steroidobacteraceae bacterium]
MDRIQRALDLAAVNRPGSGATDEAAAERTAVRREFVPAPMEPARRLEVDWVALRENRIVDWSDRRPAAQAYRMLRTQVLQRARTHHLSTIGVVSAANGEGKTLTAINLALGLAAEPNQFVLLMDLDLKRPCIAQHLRLPVHSGLEAWFSGAARLEDLWCGLAGAERLFVLPTLAPVPDSSEALASAGTAKMLQDLKERDPGRLMIIDLPPVLLSDDAITIAPHLDAVVLVVTEGRTRREDVSRVLELLGNTRVIGTVLNQSTESEKRAY